MKLIVIIATVVACSWAAPSLELQHPSPVNPNVMVEVKPEEKIVLITDPKEIAKFKREIKQPFYPTILPNEYVHHIAKRDHKPGDETKSQTENPKTPNVANKPQVPNQPSLNIRSRRNVVSSNSEHSRVEVFQKPQPLPVILPSETNVQEKPPYFPERRYSEEDRIESNEKVSKGENEKDLRDDKKVYLVNQHKSEIVSTRGHEEVEEIGKVQASSLVVKDISPDTLHHKRDIPVPLVPKLHHPEESPKEEFHEEEKKVNLENPHESQTHPSHKQDNASVQGLQKPQILQSIVKEIPVDTQQHKRDITVPAHTQEHIRLTDFQKPQVLLTHDKHIQTIPTIESSHPKQHEIHVPADAHQSKEPPQKSHYNKVETSGDHPNIHGVQDDHKPNILNAQDSSTTSTTEHAIFKNRPVPVSELFARAHNN